MFSISCGFLPESLICPDLQKKNKPKDQTNMPVVVGFVALNRKNLWMSYNGLESHPGCIPALNPLFPGWALNLPLDSRATVDE